LPAWKPRPSDRDHRNENATGTRPRVRAERDQEHDGKHDGKHDREHDRETPPRTRPRTRPGNTTRTPPGRHGEHEGVRPVNPAEVEREHERERDGERGRERHRQRSGKRDRERSGERNGAQPGTHGDHDREHAGTRPRTRAENASGELGADGSRHGGRDPRRHVSVQGGWAPCATRPRLERVVFVLISALFSRRQALSVRNFALCILRSGTRY
jgi:hypothetical protein